MFVYISEAQKGSKQYETLSEAWGGIVATNAVEEFVAGSKKFEEWFYGKKGNTIRAFDFKLNRSKGRLRIINIYEDTISIIKEMLAEEGRINDFSNL